MKSIEVYSLLAECFIVPDRANMKFLIGNRIPDWQSRNAIPTKVNRGLYSTVYLLMMAGF